MKSAEAIVHVWTPEGEAERALVREELLLILSSPDFQKSRRYPAFLTYVVEAALQGEAEKISERNLGVQVFSRTDDYDTSADPVVRYNASQVRKRLTAFYHNRPEAEIEIHLPSGSYVPEFRRRSRKLAGAEDAQSGIQVLGAEHHHATSSPLQPVLAGKRSVLLIWGAGVVVIISGLAVFAYMQIMQRHAPMDLLWGSFVSSNEPTLLVLRSEPATDKRAYKRAYISLEIEWAANRVTSVLASRKASYKIQPSSETDFASTVERPVVIFGNSPQSAKVLEHFRYSLLPYPYPTLSSRIIDRNEPNSTRWQVDFVKTPTFTSFSDYGIAARFNDPVTGGPLLVLAGIGRDGTAAAADCVTSAACLEKLRTRIGSSSLKSNFEMVVRTDVNNGQRGAPIIETAYAW